MSSPGTHPIPSSLPAGPTTSPCHEKEQGAALLCCLQPCWAREGVSPAVGRGREAAARSQKAEVLLCRAPASPGNTRS